MIAMPPPTTLRTPGLMTTAELGSWAQIGKNAIPQLVCRFHLREITGKPKNHRYSVPSVLHAILGVAPRTPAEMESLLIPLQKSSWVSQMVGLSASTISADVCENRGVLPCPVELTATVPGQAPARGRRWIPAQILAHLRGDPIPFLAPQIPLRRTPEALAQVPDSNVFAAICSDNTGVSPHRPP